MAPPSPPSPAAALPLDVEAVRRQFPALAQTINDQPLRYLDSAATSLRLRAALDAARSIDEHDAGNVHRAVHRLGIAATARFEAAREAVRGFLGAAHGDEVVFTAGATASLNLVAQGLARTRLQPGDEVLVSVLEHHANLVPWHLACAERGARLVPIPLDGSGQIDLDRYAALLGPRTRVVAVAHASNVLGTITPVAEMARLAHARGAVVVVDGAQAVAHLPVDVQALGCDFYAFSGHKLFAPTGAGVLYGRRDLLATLPPWQGGGHMITSVAFGEVRFAQPPARFEAGTPAIAAVVGLGAAIAWINDLGWPAIAAHKHALAAHALAALQAVPGLRLLSTAAPRVPVFAFTLAGVHPHDIATLLGEEGLAIRAGHHCAEPLHHALGIAASARASLSIYSTAAEVDALAVALAGAAALFAGRGRS